jgi:hypothetical protein
MHKHSSHDSHDELITAGVAGKQTVCNPGIKFEFELHHVTAFDVPVDRRETGWLAAFPCRFSVITAVPRVI